ncbi:MAG: hypothetical protein QF415_10425 [Candidatus Undinarchaeales archaeon]|jgi:hypothetical protein|nr:hypothetical protein [Candidatus Undinarchaeales archaeon]MDP7493229.1 hypothetical protein [Candidatus Undinarchaeales archaeon]
MHRTIVLAWRWLRELVLRPSFAFMFTFMVAAVIIVLAFLGPFSPFLDARVYSKATDVSLSIVLVGDEAALRDSLLARALSTRKEVRSVSYATTLDEALASPDRMDAIVVIPPGVGGTIRLLVAQEGLRGPLAVSMVQTVLAESDPPQRRRALAEERKLVVGSLQVADDYGSWDDPPLLIDAVQLFLVPFLVLFPAFAVAMFTTNLVREEFTTRTMDSLLMACPRPRILAGGLAAPTVLLTAVASGTVLLLSRRLFPVLGVAPLVAISGVTSLFLCGVGAAAAVRTRGAETSQSAVWVATALVGATVMLPRPLSPPRLAVALGTGPVPFWEVGTCIVGLIMVATLAWGMFERSFAGLAEG